MRIHCTVHNCCT